MSYQVLARKWRPKSFETMVGQEPILRMLKNALEQERIHHAYLFTGTRGVGKTTMARIIAKCLNCETGITAKPCEQCANCQAVDSGKFMDLFEIDAASRTKVEDTRELLENVCYPPAQGRYKIYLIDEVHMLSNHSFNALLKTLEEPPAHVVFLFATTDPKKIPVTILSRCLQFHLARMTRDQIAQHLLHICQTEKISAEETALTALAKAADGSMRDALSLLDQAIAYGNGSVNKQDIDTMLGSLSLDDIKPLLEALASQDGKAVFDAVNMLAECAPDFSKVLEEMISLFHQIAMTQIVPAASNDDEIIKHFADIFTPEDVQVYYQIALLGRRDLAFSPNPQQGFEMVILRMLAFLPNATSRTNTPVVSQSRPKTNRTEKTSVTKSPVKVVSQSTDKTTASTAEWASILPKLGLTGMAYALAANCTLNNMDDDKIELMVSSSHEAMLSEKLKERLRDALSRYFKTQRQLSIKVSTEELATPVKQQMQENSKQLGAAKDAVMNNPVVKQLVDIYDASVDVSLLSQV